MTRATYVPIAVTSAWIIVALATALAARQTTNIEVAHDVAETSDAVEHKINELDQLIATLTQQQQRVLEEAREARMHAADQDREWKSLVGQIDSVQTHKEELSRQEKKLETANTARNEAQVALDKAQEEFEAAKKRLEEAQANVAKATEAAKKAAEPIEAMKSQIVALEANVPQVRDSAARAEAASLELHNEIERIETRAGELATERQMHQQEIERLMREAGNWISFSEQIAPIFHQHCVSCHNARNAKGQYNMASYDAILAEGESGLAILPRDAEASSLYQHVANGSMPFEAEPLTSEQINLIHLWIEAGARVESAVDTNAPLIRIMPRRPQPLPPDAYRSALPVTALAIDASGSWLASSGYHELLIWSLPDGKLIQRISNVAERVYGIDIHPDGKRIAVASGTPGQLGEVKLFDAQSGELLADLLVSEDVQFNALFSPDGGRLATVGADGSVYLFDLNNADSPQYVIQDHADWVNSVAWSPDGRWLCTASRDKTAKIFDSESGQLKLTFSDHGRDVTQSLFVGNEQVVSVGGDRKLRFWNLSDGKQSREIGGFNSDIVAVVALENALLASISSDSVLRIHSAADASLLRESKIAEQWSASLTARTDHPFFYVGDQAGTIYQIKRDDLTVEQSWPAMP